MATEASEKVLFRTLASVELEILRAKGVRPWN